MRKLFVLIILLFLSTSVYASQLTTNYNLEIPAIGDRDWQPIISKDIISIDTVVGIISSDSIKIKFISSDVADLKLKTTIISNDISYYPIKIISHDIQIISADVAVHKLSIDVISDDVSFVRYYKLPRVPPTGNAVISYDGATLSWKPIYDQTAFSLPLSVANGGTGSTIGYTTVSNDIADIKAGGLVQVVNVQSSDVVTGSTILPFDNTAPPQNTEGDEYMVLAITPKNSNNKLKIDVLVNIAGGSASVPMTCALFQDATANAIAATSQQTTPDVNYPLQVKLTHFMTAGTTSATTFKVRVGSTANTTNTFNGTSGGRQLAGTYASSITIMEIGV